MPLQSAVQASLARRKARKRVAAWLALSIALCACSEAPSWQKLLASRITAQYPAYSAQPAPGGGLLVERPGLAPVPVDVDAIARFCLRGPKDCNYATEQMLLELQAK